ncbi:MAG: citrate/2-methylcitrate synthase, partial [Caulobacteraceae bacterium]
MGDRADGLEGVVAAETVLSDVDGEGGRLTIRGHGLEALAGWTFEAVMELLWAGFFDPAPIDLAAALGLARAEVFEQVEALDRQLLALEPIEAMRALTARLADGEDLATALRLAAAPAVFAPAAIRLRAGEAALAPDPRAGHAADILRMTRGGPGSPAEIAALDTYLVTVCDHGLNASTFAARVVASTRAGLVSAVLAGIGALKGPLHGGAPGPVIEMLDAVGEPGNARSWLEAALDRGDRLMGFGHRVYRVRDPRADALKRAVGALGRVCEAPPGRLA